jgi:hypothetical protein
MPRQNVQVQTGNRISLVFDGQTIGMVQSLRASDDWGYQETSEIGNIKVREFVPTLARHTITAAVVQMKRESLEKAGIAVETSDGALNGLVFNIVVNDKDTKQMLRTYVDCVFASGDLEVTKNAVVVRNATFLALDVYGTFNSAF